MGSSLGSGPQIVRAACWKIIDTPTSPSSASSGERLVRGRTIVMNSRMPTTAQASVAATSPSQKFPMLANTE